MTTMPPRCRVILAVMLPTSHALSLARPSLRAALLAAALAGATTPAAGEDAARAIGRRTSGEVLAACRPLFDAWAGLRAQGGDEAVEICRRLFEAHVAPFCAERGRPGAPPVLPVASYWAGFMRFDPDAPRLPFVSTITGALISSRACEP